MSGGACLAAIIPCRPEAVDVTEAALLAVGTAVAAHETDTLAYRAVRIDGDAPVLVTRKCFRDRGAMRVHNEGPASRAFFAATDSLLGDITRSRTKPTTTPERCPQACPDTWVPPP